MKIRIAFKWTFGLALAVFFLGGLTSRGVSLDIESGEWLPPVAYLDNTNRYAFYAKSNDTVIIRVASENNYLYGDLNIPDGDVRYQDRSTFPYTEPIITSWSNEFVIRDFTITATNTGWYFIYCYDPLILYDYTISILRMPHAPLSYADPDVGTILSGQNLEGVIGQGPFPNRGAADLDAATFAVSNRCTVQIRMGQKDVFLVPQIQLYDPAGHYVTNDYPPEYRAEITATLTSTGVYTVVMNDYFIGVGPYAVSMIKMGTTALFGDLDIGPIVSGETKQGTINLPGDLDAATFTGISNDYVSITMSELSGDDTDLNPVLELFGPSGTNLVIATDIFEESAVIANFALVSNGIYTIICKDAEDRYDKPPANPARRCRYSLSFVVTNSAIVPPPSPLPIPAGLTASDGDYTNGVLVTWQPAVGITNYNLWRSYLSNSVYVTEQLISTNATNYFDTAVTTNILYYYKVRSESNGSYSAFSAEDSGFIQLLIFPDGLAIESGQYLGNAALAYTFFATPGELVIIRAGHAEGADADVNVFYPTGYPAPFTKINDYEYYVLITRLGWYTFTCAGSPPVSDVSILRIPNIPLSYADLDVGTLTPGESKIGTIAVSSDLDAGFFAVTNRVTVQIRLGQKTVQMVPNVRLFDPQCNPVTNDYPPEYRAEITATLTNIGIYTVVCADNFNGAYSRPLSYALTMVQIPATEFGADPDDGPVVSGETKAGSINEPGDLDVFTFVGSTGYVVNISMKEVDIDLNPVMDLYDPNGVRVVHTNDLFEREAVITNLLLLTNGIYTIVCKDAQDRFSVRYTMTFVATNLYPPPTPPPMPVPTGVAATDGAYVDRIAVTWNAVPGITNYNLWRRNGAVDINLCTTNALAYDDSAVSNNTVYYYRVRVVSNGVYGAFSAEDGGFCQRAIVGDAIESGQYFTDAQNALSIETPADMEKNYTFFAEPGETIIIRMGSLTDSYPDFAMYNPNSTAAAFVQFGAHEYHLAVANYGWHWFNCTLPIGYTNLAFNVSMLRIPGMPLSYDDLDVGTLPLGQSKVGTISVSADLDAGFFTVTNRCSVQMRMGQKNVNLVPNIRLYGPDGQSIASDFPPEYRAEISRTLTNSGIYTIVCADEFNGVGQYALTLVKIPGTLEGTDTDVGVIISGETKNGAIHEPGDLDIATFTALAGDIINAAMTDVDIELNPVMDLYDPSCNRIWHATDPYERSAAITNLVLTNSGVYTLVLKEAQDRYDVSYSVYMEYLPGSPSLLLNKPLPPSDLTASDGTYADNILVTWTASTTTNVTGYDIWRSTNNITFTQITTNRPSTAYQDYSIQSNILYYYRVAARNAYVLSDFSNTDSGYCGSMLPAPVTFLTASDGTYPNYILVNWTLSASTDVTGYDVWRRTWTNDYIQIATNWYSQAYLDYGATPNLVYTYRVSARNIFGVSTFSPEDSGYCGATNLLGGRRALLVGIDHYSPDYGPTDLGTCINDANGVRDTVLLADPSNRWAAANLVTLNDTQATKQSIRSRIMNMAADSGAGDVALYFHSSHGGQSPGSNPSNTFICAYDASYTDAELGSDLALFRPDTTVVIILDTCFSGGMFKLDGAPKTEWLFVERVMEHYRQAKEQQYKGMGLAAPKDLGTNIAFMTASDYNELSWTSDFYSLYTRFLIQGCSLALVDTSLDKQYNFLELHNYAGQEAVLVQPTQRAQSYNPALLEATIARALPTNPLAVHFVNNDFDGDGASDLAVFQPATGLWRIASLKRWLVLAWDNFVWGGPGFVPFDGDYNADRASDLNVYNPSSGEWRIASLKQAYVISSSFFLGGPNQTPVCGDYNGDRISDIALYQQPDGYWYILTSTGIQLVWGASYTGIGFIPVSGDFDGDQISDLAMYHVSTGYWYIGSLARGTIAWGAWWGGSGLIPITGDYDNDGYSDLAVYQSATGYWFIYSLRRGMVIVNGAQLGGPGYIPVAGDYNGDGFFDLAVYQPSTGYWYFSTADGTQTFALLYPIGGPGYLTVQPTW